MLHITCQIISESKDPHFCFPRFVSIWPAPEVVHGIFEVCPAVITSSFFMPVWVNIVLGSFFLLICFYLLSSEAHNSYYGEQPLHKKKLNGQSVKSNHNINTTR